MILDVVVLIILVLSAFIGYKKGLVGIIMSIASLVISIILAVCLQGSITNYLYNETTIGTTIESGVKTTIEDEIENLSEKNIEENSYLSTFFEDNEIATLQVNEAANKITLFVLKGISFVGIFILVSIICYILTMILNIVCKLPILNSINKVGGVSLNIIKNIFKIWIILAIISFVAFVPIFESFINLIDSSVITKFLYNNNIIVNILKSTLNF